MQLNRLSATLVLSVLSWVTVLFLPPQGHAHPMGNFSINHFSALAIYPTTIRLSYVIDMAEIPTFQEMQAWGVIAQADHPSAQQYREQKVQELQRGLLLRIGTQTLLLSSRSSRLTFPPGAGGLPTLRLAIEYEAALSVDSGTLVYEDQNYPQRAGWKEIIAIPYQGVVFTQTSVPRRSTSQQLTNYGVNLLHAPPQDLRAEVSVSVPAGARAAVSSAPAMTETMREAAPETTTTPRGWFTELTTVRQLTPGIMLLSLVIALGLGAFHALEPGHGKTLVAAYLVGTRGTMWDALVLGVTVTLSHTLSVFLLGAVALFASHHIVPEQLYPWLELGSGLLIAGMGLVLLRHAWLRYQRLSDVHAHNYHDHDHHHHGHDEHAHRHVEPNFYQHTHTHEQNEKVSYGTLLTLGVTGGIIPCPGALVVLLSAVALQRIAFGLLLIVAFSLGLAVVLISAGLLVVSARGVVQRWSGDGPWQTYLPFLSPLVMTPLGLVLAIRALTSGS